MNNNTYFDGRTVKGFNIPFSLDSDFGWDIFGEMNIPNDKMLPYVAAAQRAMQLNAQAVGTMPFAIVDKSGNDVLLSEDWHESDHAITQLIPDPESIMGKIHKSIAMRNASFLFMDKKQGVTYLAPDTIKVDADSENGIKGFWRKMGTKSVYIPAKSGLIIPLIKTDWDGEILPSANTDFVSIMNSVGIVYKSDYFVSDFFGRGGIKPSLIKVAGMPTAEEKTRIQEWFDKLLSGLIRNRSKVVNADMMDVQPLGEGLEAFKDNEFYRSALQNIAIGQGIPIDLLLTDAANFATARVHNMQWYKNKIVPDSKWIARRLTVELFSRMDLRMDIRENQTNPDQEEENMRAVSFSVFAGVFQKSGHPRANSLAAQLVGLDLPQGVEYEDLDERDESRVPQAPAPFGQQQQSQGDIEEPQEEEEQEIPQKGFAPNADQLKELHNWQDIAMRKFKRGEGVPTWESKTVPADIATAIEAKLQAAVTQTDVQNAFDMTQTTTAAPVYSDGELKYLADAINKLAEKNTTEAKNTYFNMPPLTLNLPERSITINPEVKQDAPIVNVSVPEQPAPVVNVTNEVNPTPVEVKNDVTVQPAPVVVNAPKKAKVKRDREGRIEGIESE